MKIFEGTYLVFKSNGKRYDKNDIIKITKDNEFNVHYYNKEKDPKDARFAWYGEIDFNTCEGIRRRDNLRFTVDIDKCTINFENRWKSVRVACP